MRACPETKVFPTLRRNTFSSTLSHAAVFGHFRQSGATKWFGTSELASKHGDQVAQFILNFSHCQLPVFPYIGAMAFHGCAGSSVNKYANSKNRFHYPGSACALQSVDLCP